MLVAELVATAALFGCAACLLAWLGRSAVAMRRWRGVERLAARRLPAPSESVGPVTAWGPFASYRTAGSWQERSACLLELRHAVDIELMRARLSVRYSWRLNLFVGLTCLIALRPQSVASGVTFGVVIGVGTLLTALLGRRVEVEAKRLGRGWGVFIRHQVESLNRVESVGR